MKQNNFYIYFHITEDTKEIFYVGKGKDYRAKRKGGRGKLWENIVKKHGYEIEYLHTNISEKEAFELEVYYINKIGRRDLGLGPLINFTNGGEGSSGHILTQEHKDKIGKSLKGRIFSEEHIRKNIESKLGKKRPEEFCKKMSEIRKGTTASDETRKKLSEAGKGRVHSEESKNKIKISNKISAKSKYKPIIQMDLENNIIKEFQSITEASEKTKLDKSRISKCCKGNAKTTGGFKWKFK